MHWNWAFYVCVCGGGEFCVYWRGILGGQEWGCVFCEHWRGILCVCVWGGGGGKL